MTVPKASRLWTSGSGKDGQDGASEERDFGEAVDSFGGMDELAMGTDHLLGGEGELLDRPAVGVEGIDALSRKRDRSGEQPRLFERRVMKGIDIEGVVSRVRNRFG